MGILSSKIGPREPKVHRYLADLLLRTLKEFKGLYYVYTVKSSLNKFLKCSVLSVGDEI